MDPPAQFHCCANPIPLVDSPPQCRSLQPARTEVKSEVNDGCQPRFRLGGQHWTLSQCGGERRHQVLC